MSEIEALTSRIKDLTDSADFWNKAMLWALVAAALAAVLVVLTTRLAISKAKELSVVQGVLDKEKEKQLQGILKDKDVEIGNAQRDAAEANRSAGEGNKFAAKANERAAELEKQNLKLREKLANRRITKEQHDILVGFLSKKSGRITIETMGDSESGLFASDILQTFTDAKWETRTFLPLGSIWTGLIVYQSDNLDTRVVAQALNAAQIPFSWATEKRGDATIMVGGKPPIF